jgi:hypothetical protein
MVMFMSQSSSKPAVKVAARGRRRALGREVPAKPAVDVRPFARWQAGTKNGATGLQSYAQWAGFMAGTQNGDFGFGAYFVDDTPSGANSAQGSPGMTRYTWTPAERG